MGERTQKKYGEREKKMSFTSTHCVLIDFVYRRFDNIRSQKMLHAKRFDCRKKLSQTNVGKSFIYKCNLAQSQYLIVPVVY
jgi:hypothetical protein